MKEVKGSRTEQNLLRTFAGEARARDKYDLYAEKAKKEGLEWVATIFNQTALNEYAHAREGFARYLGKVKSTEMNLLDAAKGEAAESSRIYKDFENVARSEGYEEIGDFFKELSEVEENHQIRFMALYNRLKNGTMFKGDKNSKWECMNCGYIHVGEEAPLVCPLCKYPRAYFRPYCENYK